MKLINFFRQLFSKAEIVEAVNDRYIYEPVPVSSFKDRADHIKRKYNHKFKNKPTQDNFMEGIQDLDKFFF